MNVKQAAARTGLPAKTLRYYEDIGLVRPGRADNGYRDYDASHIDRLTFIARARSLGFSLNDCRQLLSLYDDRERTSAEVRRLASNHLDEIDRKLAELYSVRETLSRLVEACHGDQHPDCPIVDDLSGPSRPAK
ncbi:Cu(I)-responsive transcriptional regulator [Maricaulis sp. CAU 1757]